MRRDVLDDQHLAGLEDPPDLRVLVEDDRQIAQITVVARRDDIPDVAFVSDEHDAASIHARDFGDTTNDGEEAVAKVERGGERLRELEDDPRVALSAP